MKILVGLFLMAIGWLFAVAIFEGLFNMPHSVKIPKIHFCRIWWAFLILIALGLNGASLLFNLPVLLPIAWSHIQLCRQQAAPITPRQIVHCIGAAGARLMSRWSSRTGRR